MHEKIVHFIESCARSKVGRFVFVAYLVYIVSMIGYAYGHIPFTVYPFRFYGERELFEALNWPQLELIRSSRLMFRWQASKFTDAVTAVYIALPWWIYGYVFERIVKEIADTTPRTVDVNSLPEFEAEKYFESTVANELPPAAVFDKIRRIFAVRRTS